MILSKLYCPWLALIQDSVVASFHIMLKMFTLSDCLWMLHVYYFAATYAALAQVVWGDVYFRSYTLLICCPNFAWATLPASIVVSVKLFCLCSVEILNTVLSCLLLDYMWIQIIKLCCLRLVEILNAVLSCLFLGCMSIHFGKLYCLRLV